MPESLPPSSRQTEGQDRCDLDAYSLFGDSADGPIGVTPVRPQQPISTRDNGLPHIPVTLRPEPRQPPYDRRSAVMFGSEGQLHSDENEAPFSGGICRQLAAMYTDVGMTTVEHLTLFRCYMVSVLAFLALNYAQMAQLVWLVFITLSAELATKCIDKCAGTETKAVFIVLLAVATGIFHWRVVTVTRHYVREFRMMADWGSEAYLYDASYSRVVDSSTLATESSVSGVSVSVVVDSEHQSIAPYHADNPQLTRL
ncbi:hypothetical protein PC129_g12760 [Phytophthora cactorum]|uniref:Uncharacterized protein n=1 Tax=Phytophthora cactorum TaxID=29920 RepID=A0A8T1K887_9STRA|nr:hypothetical protein PC111_g14735 [Phytophthora cactorum]KAG2851720.1 hypothetical protein PC113_g15661 [Phytophthora cactorum]KAG2894735.1 hypothetical protein PC114_g15781 [Phytophthora cactorum]KAG2907606.1 hypothetical protein PC115_g13865 [Phytophthora cactorum]KAG2974348.1 hypothetical protein PC118_g14565 [Phytophthora cactorum]